MNRSNENNSSLKVPFINNSQKYNFDSWFDSSKQPPFKQKPQSENPLKPKTKIDYSLESRKYENPFKPKTQSKQTNQANINQYERNLDFFNQEQENEPHEYNDDNEQIEKKTQYLYENEVSDAKVLFKVNKHALEKLTDEYIISEEKSLPIPQLVNLNKDSKGRNFNILRII